MGCSSCGKTKPTAVARTIVTKTQGIKHTRPARLPLAQPILRNLPKPLSVSKIAPKGGPAACPLCGGALQAVTQTGANKSRTFLQCANTVSCDYKRKL